MADTLDPRLQALLDRQAIEQILTIYTRTGSKRCHVPIHRTAKAAG
jgi:hypothetical protein